ncbi:MAG: outer membrane beta-barrel protein [Bacteroidales bacterium]|nr:outer membrane beta-barrel protein [Bacteroidales bacterium]MDD2241633.1 outer membrane beta-barrel protein [Bacteroidales bacterium]
MKKILTIAIAALAVFAGQSVSAQDFHYGITAGGNASTVKVDDINMLLNKINIKGDNSRKAGFYVGIVSTYNFNDKMGLQAEVEYTQEGTKMNATLDKSSLDAMFAASSGLPLSGMTFPNQTINNADGTVTTISNITATGLTASHNFNQVTEKSTWNFGKIEMPIMFTYKPIAGLSVMAGPYFSYRVSNNFKLGSDFSRDVKDVIDNVTLNVAYSGTATTTAGGIVVDTRTTTGTQTISAANAIAMTIGGQAILAALEGSAGKSMIESYVKDNLNDYVKKFDFGASFGAKYALTSQIAVELRWDFSLMNNLKDIKSISLPSEVQTLISQNQAATQYLTAINTALSSNPIKLKGHNNSLKLGLIYMF